MPSNAKNSISPIQHHEIPRMSSVLFLVKTSPLRTRSRSINRSTSAKRTSASIRYASVRTNARPRAVILSRLPILSFVFISRSESVGIINAPAMQVKKSKTARQIEIVIENCFEIFGILNSSVKFIVMPLYHAKYRLSITFYRKTINFFVMKNAEKPSCIFF